MRLLHHDPHTESIGHDGEQYERDEHGAFELPHKLAEDLLERFPHLWSVAPDPVPAEPVKAKRTPAKAKQEPEPETVVEDEDPQDEDPAKTEDPADEPPVQAADDPAPKPRARKNTAAAQ